ncbi:MAG: neuromedin U [Planctomycetota bacterium]
MRKWIILLMVAGVFVSASFADEAAPQEDVQSSAAESADDEKAALAKAVQNPVADLISVPFQWNIGFDTGPEGATGSVLNIQPVIPFNLNEDWNLITRTIVPIINQPPMGALGREEWGLGNIQFSSFFSPKDSGEWIWGVGPIFEFPTKTNDILASDNYSAGPTFVALKMDGPWVYGGLINQLWSFCGDDPEVNKMLIQPFVNYNMDDGWYLVSAPIMIADWTRDSNNQWTIPVGGGIGKIVKIGKLPLNLSTNIYYNVESPDTGSNWSVRFQVQFLFPK